MLSSESVLFELVWCQNSPTREQRHRAMCRLDFQEDLSGEACEWQNWGLSKEQLIWVGSCYSSKLRRWPRSKADSQLAPQGPRELSGGGALFAGGLTACHMQAGILVIIMILRAFMGGVQSTYANPIYSPQSPSRLGAAIAQTLDVCLGEWGERGPGRDS